ncbi:MAG: type II toxin-antitoxin system RatA family toxin [Candidatus Paracaedibacteraceae bacterium]|nr:type II toxin-antitoxin system RatA family toxin [Candidatus Paracaedibacteraceae bacterium]
MPVHAEKRIVPYTPEQMYALVVDVNSYPEFLPWILSVQIYNKSDSGFEADLSIGASLINQRYSSNVILQPGAKRIEVTHTKGPFRYLNNHWIFHTRETGCEVEFYLDFELDTPFLKPILQPFLNQAVAIMVDAFQKRAEKLYKKI